MKLKFLLLFFLIANFVGAQEAYNNLVITEARMVFNDFNDSYYEITNMGETPIDLSEIKFVKGMKPGFEADEDGFFYLPESVTKVLQPGESYVMTVGLDFSENLKKARIPGFSGARGKKHDIYKYADFIAHREEKSELDWELYPNIKDSAIYSPDSVFNNTSYVFSIGHLHRLNKGVWLEHHFAEGDSAVIDQVGNMFDGGNGNNTNTAWDVAGVTGATGNSVLVRKNSIKTGNLDFANSLGVGLDDSEWLPLVPAEGEDNWRDTWWTVGNHGAFVLDENTLEPETAGFEVDFTGKTITVPWGTRRLDDIMRNMKYKPGVAWTYHLNESVEDSLLRSAQNGDKLTVYVVGETLYQEVFEIKVKEPSQADNVVIPIDHRRVAEGPVTYNVQNGKLTWPRVSNHGMGMDTITGVSNGLYGLPHALRTDSLAKYLEKPANATWEFVFVDGMKRADLKNGDVLKITAQNGAVKEYFIEVQAYGKSHNANLSVITWPDINLSEIDKFVLGWTTGDTIPNFNINTTNYRVKLPFDAEIPALVAKTFDLNATIKVDRARSLEGGPAERTTTFEITAEDDSVKKVYTVEFVREQNPMDVQPYHAEPFLSQFSCKTNGNNNFMEICNPGNQPLDLSNYMIVAKNSLDPTSAITTSSGTDDWSDRYERYIPGYKWVDDLEWLVNPSTMVQDITVNPVIMPGDVFVFGTINDDDHIEEGMEWSVPKELDVQFWNKDLTYASYQNPWAEDVGQAPVPNTFTEEWWLFKITNDSVKLGLKTVGDPNDFELIEVWGNADGKRIKVAGEIIRQRHQFIRKPEFIYPNPVLGASFGENEDDSEWIQKRPSWYSDFGGLSGGDADRAVESDLGQHFFNPYTGYISTVTAVVYKVDKGYEWNPDPLVITGMVTGTTVEEFVSNLFKADEGQSLTLKSMADGSELAMDALLSLNDTLVVMSADSTNTTKYVLNVDETGLNSNALLTSDRYQIEIQTQPKSAGDAHEGAGTISGFEYGTSLVTIINNVTKPADATMSVIDGDGAYVSLKRLNFDTTYVEVTANPNTYFEVVAEDGVTKIVYQLLPQTSANDAFVLSDIYAVDQKDLLIEFVPNGTTVPTLLANVVPSVGATIKVVDKNGIERTEGVVANDDKLVVTSVNGSVTKAYFIAKLATEFITETTYLAYITSNSYGIDQVENVIYGVGGNTLVSDFYSRIVPSMGANAVLVDADGNEKTSGDIDGGDMVKVTSVDGKITVMYTFGTLTDVNVSDFKQIELYPNPTDSRINIKGLDSGNRIKVFNSTGIKILDVISSGSNETISLNGEASGLYLIVISNKNELLGRFKAVKK